MFEMSMLIACVLSGSPEIAGPALSEPHSFYQDRIGSSDSGITPALSEPHAFFKDQIGLSDAEITTIDGGGVVVKMLASRTPAEVFVFGAAYVNAAAEDYLDFAMDLSRLQSLSSYLAVRRFGDPPTLSDLQDFALEPDDIKSIRDCRPGKCDVQLSPQAMLQLQRAVDWSAPDVAEQVNERVRRMVLDLLVRYQERGNTALEVYGDKRPAFDADAAFLSLLSRPEVMAVDLPELRDYLLDYPAAVLPDVVSFFCWEKVDFGLKPTLRLTHVFAYRSSGPGGMVNVVAAKQLWANHYFQLALDLSASVPAAVPVSRRGAGAGSYIISVKGSTQQGLTGLMGFFRRSVVVHRTLSAQENSLLDIKQRLERRD